MGNFRICYVHISDMHDYIPVCRSPSMMFYPPKLTLRALWASLPRQGSVCLV